MLKCSNLVVLCHAGTNNLILTKTNTVTSKLWLFDVSSSTWTEMYSAVYYEFSNLGRFFFDAQIRFGKSVDTLHGTSLPIVQAKPCTTQLWMRVTTCSTWQPVVGTLRADPSLSCRCPSAEQRCLTRWDRRANDRLTNYITAEEIQFISVYRNLGMTSIWNSMNPRLQVNLRPRRAYKASIRLIARCMARENAWSLDTCHFQQWVRFSFVQQWPSTIWS